MILYPVVVATHSYHYHYSLAIFSTFGCTSVGSSEENLEIVGPGFFTSRMHFLTSSQQYQRRNGKYSVSIIN